MMYRKAFLLSLFVNSTGAFCLQSTIKTSIILKSQNNPDFVVDRRSAMIAALATGIFTMATAANAADDDLTRGGVPLTPFNGLAFQYRGNGKNGLDASTLNEPSVSYIEFLERIDKGEVEFVEFMAPSGDAAYATFKVKEGEIKEKPIRIGEGYPLEDPEGWSSPAFVVKIVKKKEVPYKFTVPGLARYSN